MRLGHLLDIILGRPQDVRSGHPQEGQIGSLEDVLGMLEGDVLGMVLGTNICWLEMFLAFQMMTLTVYNMYSFSHGLDNII